MFSFFRKKRPEPKGPEKQLPEQPAAPAAAPAETAADRRGEYRVRKTGLQVLAVRLKDARGVSFPCECDDLALGGVALNFPREPAPKIAEGEELVVEFQMIARKNCVRAKARVVSLAREGTRLRCGLVFVDAPDLVRQLDAHYARFFNRRKHPRALPDLSTKFKVQLAWSGGTLEVRAQDFSLGGLGLVLASAEAERLVGVEELEARFQLPECKTQLALRSRVASLRSLSKGKLLGLEFLPDSSAGAKLEALRVYVESRIAKMTQWNEAAQRKAG